MHMRMLECDSYKCYKYDLNISSPSSQIKMMAVWSAVIAVCIWSLGEHVRPVDSSHFMGGVIHWRPMNPAAFDGRVRAHLIKIMPA